MQKRITNICRSEKLTPVDQRNWRHWPRDWRQWFKEIETTDSKRLTPMVHGLASKVQRRNTWFREADTWLREIDTCTRGLTHSETPTHEQTRVLKYKWLRPMNYLFIRHSYKCRNFFHVKLYMVSWRKPKQLMAIWHLYWGFINIKIYRTQTLSVNDFKTYL